MNNRESSCKLESRPKSSKEWVKSKLFWKSIIAAFVGAGLGWAYYYYIGCASGSCPITSNPYMSIIFGGFTGLWLVNRPCKSCA